jgi:hypothetical protein
MAKNKVQASPDFDMKDIGLKLDQILDIEKKTNKLMQADEKYMTAKNNSKEVKEKEKYKEQERRKYAQHQKDLKKSQGFLSDLLGWFAKMAALVIAYKVAEWIGKPENTKKLAKVLKGAYAVCKFLMDLVDGTIWGIIGTLSNAKKLGKSFSEFFNNAGKFANALLNPVETMTNVIKETPKVIGDGFNNLLKGVEGILTKSAEVATKEAESEIKDGVKSLAPEKTEEKKDITPAPESATPIIKPDQLPKVKVEDKPAAAEPKKVPTVSALPKLAKGGVVSNNKVNNIKPLSTLLTGNTNNEKFNNDIKKITPDFEQLLKLPFEVIGKGILSALRSSIKDENVLMPMLTNIGKSFDVPINEINEEKEDSGVTKTSKDDTAATKDDTDTKDILSDILSILSDKKAVPQMSIGGVINGKSSGWIDGSNDGYPVSLDGKNTSFIGHGKEYVAKHKTNSDNFVIPFETPATKQDKGLTKRRINEAIKGGYELPSNVQKMADGGKVMVNRSGMKDERGLEKLNVNVLDTEGNSLLKLIANSGVSSKQTFVAGGQSESGSLMPMEYGDYNIGNTVAGNPQETVGSTFMPLNPKFSSKRQAVGIHLDANRTRSPGSAGCLVFSNQVDLDKFRSTVIPKKIKNLSFTNTIDSNIASTNPTETGQQTQNQTANSTSMMPDFGMINKAISSLTQMLGITPKNNDTSANTTTPPVTTNNANPVPAVTPLPTNKNSANPVPAVTPLPTVQKIKQKTKTKKTDVNRNLLSSGNKVNIADKQISSSAGFNYSSDANRFTALASMNGIVTEPIFV